MCYEFNFMDNLIYENDIDIQEQERKEDLNELIWLQKECKNQLCVLEKYSINDSFCDDIVGLYSNKLRSIYNRIKYYVEKNVFFNFEHYIDMKYELRAILKQIVGLHTSFNWQSPGSSNESRSLIECSLLQKNQFTYMRTHTSEQLSHIESRIIKEYYGLQESDDNFVGYLTNSGMKSLEVAIVLQKITCLNNFPVYYHEGIYFESKELVNRLYTDPIQINSEQLYSMLESAEQNNCIILDTGVNWPAKKNVDIDLLFEKLEQHKQREPLFLIIDCTLTSISSKILSRYRKRIPKNVILVTVESMLKYFQMGLELTNLGFVAFYGYLLKRQLYKDIVFDLLRTLTAIPDDSLIKRIPELPIDYLKCRLNRISRNTKYLYKYFDNLRKNNIIESVVSSVSQESDFYIDDQKWMGSILYIRFKKFDCIEQYEKFAKDFIYDNNYYSLISYGMSFGFDTTRVCAIQDLKLEGAQGLCLRITVGKDTLLGIKELITDLNEYIIKCFKNEACEEGMN